MTEIEKNRVVLNYFIQKRDELVEELNILIDNVKVLDSAIDFMNNHGNYNFSELLDVDNLKGKTLASMYLDRERLQRNILDKERLIKYFLDIILEL